MKFLIISGSIFVPLCMYVIQIVWLKIRLFFNGAALLSGLIFGNLSAIGIYKIIQDKTVFMTNIHGLFLNPFFLLTGAYLGMYFLYQLLVFTFEDNFEIRK